MRRHYECTEEGAGKFWEFEIGEGSSEVHVRFGRIGTSGTSQVKVLETPEEAQSFALKTAASKEKKGYRLMEEVTASKAEEPAPLRGIPATRLGPWLQATQGPAAFQGIAGRLPVTSGDASWITLMGELPEQATEDKSFAWTDALGEIYLPQGVQPFVAWALEAGEAEALAQLVRQAGAIQKASKRPIWATEETLFGSDLAFLLALHDKAWVGPYCDFLLVCDPEALDHDTLCNLAYHCLLARHGYGSEMCSLLAVLGARTQFGEDLLSEQTSDQAFAEALAGDMGLDRFLKLVSDELSAGKLRSRAEVQELVQGYRDALERQLADNNYLRVDVHGVKVALMGRTPVDRDLLARILILRGAISVEEAPTRDTQLMLCPPKDLECAKARKAQEQGVRVMAYPEAFDPTAWRNHLAEKAQALLEAADQNRIDEMRRLEDAYWTLFEPDFFRWYAGVTLEQGSIDAAFEHFLERHWQGNEERILCQLMESRETECVLEKLEAILLHHPVDLNLLPELLRAAVMASDWNGQRALAVDRIRLLVRHGMDVNAADAEGCTMLHYECGCKFNPGSYDLNLVAALLELGADPERPDRQGATPFSCATGNSDGDFYDKDEGNHCFDYSRDWQVPGVAPYRYLKRTSGAFQCGFDLVKLLVESGRVELDFGKTMAQGRRNALAAAAREGSWQILDYLLEVGTPWSGEGETPDGDDPFTSWMIRCDPEVFNLDLFKKAFEKGARPNQWSDVHRDSLFYSVRRGIVSLKATALLLDLGADPHRPERDGTDSCASFLRALAAKDPTLRSRLLELVTTPAARATVQEILA